METRSCCRVLGVLLATTAGAMAQDRAETGRLVGHVVDALGDPVPLADVRVSGCWPRAFGDAIARTRADAEGMFVLRDLPFEVVQVWASAPGHVRDREQIRITREQPQTFASLRLWDAGVIEGRIVDGSGAPAPGVHVAAGFAHPSVFDFEARSEVVTKDDGRFRLDDAPLGHVEIRTWCPGFLSACESLYLRDTASLKIELAKGEGVRIRVRTRGVPATDCAQVRVIVLPYDELGGVVLPTAARRGSLREDGTWVQSGLPVLDSYSVSLLSPRYRLGHVAPKGGPVWKVKNSPGPYEFAFTAKPRVAPEVVPEPGARAVTCSVVDRAGIPVRHAVISLQEATPDGWERRGTDERTDRDGRFTWTGVKHGAELRVCTGGRLGFGISPSFELASPALVKVVVSPPAVIEGVVRDGDGGPIPGACVIQRARDGEHVDLFQREVVLTDRAGRYRFVDARPGTYQLDVLTTTRFTGTTSDPFTVRSGECDTREVIVPAERPQPADTERRR